MRVYDLIKKKRDGGEHSKEELQFLIDGYVKGEIPDYQIAAWLMAVYFQDMTFAETSALTQAIVLSGEQVDLSAIDGIKVDKHSTGGVGDKTTLIVGPIVAACGMKLAKMSGRGLGHTGGTLDKLESIPGYSTELSEKEFVDQVQRIGLAVIGQTAELAPGDKKLYALRDVTATVDSLPLIASSIMSKKIAAGSDAIILDVKCGSGAFMESEDDAIELAQLMVKIGEDAGIKTAALVTDMDRPLGQCIGNALEVEEAIRTLHGEVEGDLLEVCLELSAGLLALSDPEKDNKKDHDYYIERARKAIADRKALERFALLVEAQGGNAKVTEDLTLLPQAKFVEELQAKESAWVSKMDAEACGIASSMLGAGRMTMEDVIQPAAGIRLYKKTGDWVEKGEVIAKLYTDDQSLINDAKNKLEAAYSFTQDKVPEQKLIHARVTKDAVTRL